MRHADQSKKEGKSREPLFQLAVNISKENRLMRFTLRGARLVDATDELPQSEITIEGTRIQALGSTREPHGAIIDATGMIVTPGFIDVHTHGGGSFNLHTKNVEEIHAYRHWVAGTG